MDEVGQLLRLFEVGRMGCGELERLVSELDEEDRGGARSLHDLETWARAASEVDSVERLMERSARQTGRDDDRGSRRRSARAVSVDMDSYERSKVLLGMMAEEQRARDELREAARVRLSHFEKREGLRYQPADRTPLERYQKTLLRVRDSASQNQNSI